jgi:hypothetical protein
MDYGTEMQVLSRQSHSLIDGRSRTAAAGYAR